MLLLLLPVFLLSLRLSSDLDLRRLRSGLSLLRFDRLLVLSPVDTISVTETLLSSVSFDLLTERIGLLELAFLLEIPERPPCCLLVGADLPRLSLCRRRPELLMLVLLSLLQLFKAVRVCFLGLVSSVDWTFETSNF